MARTQQHSIAKRANNRSRTRLSQVQKQVDMVNGGVHCHWKDWENKEFTGKDGYHDHLFIIGGKLVRTNFGGEHRHPITGEAIGPQLQAHQHDMFIDGQLFGLEPGGAHSHPEGFDPEYPDMVLPGGEHRHTVEVNGVTYESITAADVLAVAIRKSMNLGIQSVIFSKDRFLTWEKAAQKAESLGLELKKAEERGEAFVFTQRDHSKFKELSLQTITLEDGVDAVIGVLEVDGGESDVTLTPGSIAQAPEVAPPAKVEIEMPGVDIEIEIETFDKVQQAQTLGYVMMSAEQAESLKNLKDEFAGQVQALKRVVEVIAAPVTKFIDGWIEKAETSGLIELLDRVNTEMVLLDEALGLTDLSVDVQLEKSLQEDLSKIEADEHLAFALKTMNDVLSPVIELFSETSFENFHNLCKATQLSSILLIKEHLTNLSIEKSLVPMDDMTREELRLAQEARSSKWGIEIVAGSALTFPSGFPTDLNEYGDPVNLKFPFDSEERAANARVRFKQFANQIYSKEESKKIVHNRIVKKELSFGINVTISESDPLDQLLSSDLKNSDGVTVTKEDEVSKSWFVPILKASEEERTVFGIVLEPNVTDLHKDTYDDKAVIDAAHHFLEEMQNIGKNHTQIINGEVKIQESYVAPVDMNLETPSGKVKIKKNTWLMKVRIISDEIWQQVKNGELTGFSIGALAQVTSLKE